jgi:hypothetical protein
VLPLFLFSCFDCHVFQVIMWYAQRCIFIQSFNTYYRYFSVYASSQYKIPSKLIFYTMPYVRNVNDKIKFSIIFSLFLSLVNGNKRVTLIKIHSMQYIWWWMNGYGYIYSPIQWVVSALFLGLSGQGIKLTTHFCLVPRLRMCVAIPPFPNTSSYHGA